MVSCRHISAVAPLVLVLLAFNHETKGQSEGFVDEQVRERLDTFFNALEDEEITAETAIQGLLDGSPLANNLEKINRLVESLESFDDNYGRLVTAEPIVFRPIGSNQDLVIAKYLYKAERYPVAWHFTFYRAPSRVSEKELVVIALRFDTKLESLLNPIP